jgi:hypothetical protein
MTTNDQNNFKNPESDNAPLARIVGGEPDWIDPSLDEVRAGLNQLAAADRAAANHGFLHAIAGDAAAETLRAAASRSSQSTLAPAWLRLAAVITLAVGVGSAWYLVSRGGSSGTNDDSKNLIATTKPAPASTNPKAEDQELDEIMLLAAAFDDGASSEIDALFTETEKIDSNMKSDWIDGGAL